jgi:hypothetical protein
MTTGTKNVATEEISQKDGRILINVKNSLKPIKMSRRSISKLWEYIKKS